MTDQIRKKGSKFSKRNPFSFSPFCQRKCHHFFPFLFFSFIYNSPLAEALWEKKLPFFLFFFFFFSAILLCVSRSRESSHEIAVKPEACNTTAGSCSTKYQPGQFGKSSMSSSTNSTGSNRHSSTSTENSAQKKIKEASGAVLLTAQVILVTLPGL